MRTEPLVKLKKEAERLGDRPACGLVIGGGREGPNVAANK
jgi:hypothetical protein